MFSRFAALARNFLQAKEGVVAIQMALMMPVLIGMGALAIDVGFVLQKQRQMQSAADAAAFSAAVALSTTPPRPNPISTEAYAVAGQVGFVNGANGVTVIVNNPPVNPLNAANANASAVQVIIQQPQTLPLVGAVCALIPGATCSGNFTVAAQAVATAGVATGACDPTNSNSPCTCALQLSPSGSPGINISGGATVNLNACGIQACSNVSLSGGARVNLNDSSGTLLTTSSSNMQYIQASGGVSVDNGAALNNNTGSCSISTPSNLTFCQSFTCGANANADPYKGVAMPAMSPGNCDQNRKSFCSGYGCTSNMVPGHYCNGPNFSYGNVTMSPGIYYIDGGQGGSFTVKNGVSLSCPNCTNGLGVTIVLTGSSGNYANVDIGGGASVTLKAPTSGTMSGILFFGDRNAPLSETNTFQGGANLNLTGALYFPTQKVILNNGSSNQSSCGQLIAGTMDLQGGTQFKRDGCPSAGTTPIGSGGGGFPAMIE